MPVAASMNNRGLSAPSPALQLGRVLRLVGGKATVPLLAADDAEETLHQSPWTSNGQTFKEAPDAMDLPLAAKVLRWSGATITY